MQFSDYLLFSFSSNACATFCFYIKLEWNTMKSGLNVVKCERDVDILAEFCSESIFSDVYFATSPGSLLSLFMLSSLNPFLSSCSCHCRFISLYKGPCHTHKVQRLNESTSYTFRIQAFNEAGEGPFSSVYTFTTPRSPPPPVKGTVQLLSLLFFSFCSTDPSCSQLMCSAFNPIWPKLGFLLEEGLPATDVSAVNWKAVVRLCGLFAVGLCKASFDPTAKSIMRV